MDAQKAYKKLSCKKMQINMLNTKFTKLPIAIAIGFAIVLCSHIGFAQRVTIIDEVGTKHTAGNTVTQAATAPVSPAPIQGDVWIDTTNGVTNVWNGSAWLEIKTASALTIWDEDTDTGIQVEESDDKDVIHFDTAGLERVVIDETGNVGIGTSAPSVELHVNGKTRIETIDAVTDDPPDFTQYRVLAADSNGEVHSILPTRKRTHSVRYSSDGGGLTNVPQGVPVHVYITYNCQSSKARALIYKFGSVLEIVNATNTVNFGSWSGSGTDTLTITGSGPCPTVTHTITISGADIIHTSDNPGYSQYFVMESVY
jgi:hypothetical protein